MQKKCYQLSGEIYTTGKYLALSPIVLNVNNLNLMMMIIVLTSNSNSTRVEHYKVYSTNKHHQNTKEKPNSTPLCLELVHLPAHCEGCYKLQHTGS